MKQLLAIMSLSFLILSCGGSAESDVVSINGKGHEYIFQKNKDYTADTSIKNFSAKLSLYSDFYGTTHFTVKLDGTVPGEVYYLSVFNADTTKVLGIADSEYFSFNSVNAIDTSEITFSNIQPISLDSFINYYKGYLIVTNSKSSIAADSTFIIKGKIR